MQATVSVNVGCLLSAAISLARRAGKAIEAIHKSGDLQTQEKGVAQKEGFDDPLTLADLRSQRIIMSGLWSAFPGLSIVGEETITDMERDPEALNPELDLLEAARIPEDLRSVQLSDLCVYVDPLDGTKEFSAGYTWCVTTLVGITYRGVPVGGVIHQPFENHSIYALRGYGVVGVQKKERKPEHVGKVVAVTSLSHFTDALKEAMELIKPDVVVRDGGCGYKSYMILQGVVDAYVYPQKGTKKWDTCAPEAILREAGCSVSDAAGKPLKYPTTGDMVNASLMISANSSLHDRVIKALEPMAAKNKV